MKNAKISEIFSSIQGEGLYFGIPQLFIRFYDCNLSCGFCDTSALSFQTLTTKMLIKKISKYIAPYHSISLTGGEPLLQVDFLLEFLPEYKKQHKKIVYLETNGTLPDALDRVIDHIDIIAMDFKLPSSTARKSYWKEHERFLRIAGKKKVFIKAVVTNNTSAAEVVALGDIVGKINSRIPVILQPATVPEARLEVLRESLEHHLSLLTDMIKRVEIIPQVHKMIGVK